MTVATTNLEAAVLHELLSRSERCPEVLTPALVEEYGREVLPVLWKMHRERKVRLVAPVAGIDAWEKDTGSSRADAVEDDGEWFVAVELPR